MIEKNLTIEPIVTEALKYIEVLTGVSISDQIVEAIKIHIRLSIIEPEIQKEIFDLLESDPLINVDI